MEREALQNQKPGRGNRGTPAKSVTTAKHVTVAIRDIPSAAKLPLENAVSLFLNFVPSTVVITK